MQAREHAAIFFMVISFACLAALYPMLAFGFGWFANMGYGLICKTFERKRNSDG